MVLPVRPMDANEQVTVVVDVEILISDAPCQNTAGDFGGSPTD